MTAGKPSSGVELRSPWASEPPDEDRLREASREFLAALGVPEDAEILEASAARMGQAWSQDLLCGYRHDPAAAITSFPAGDDRGLVVVREIEFTSFCVHHLLPFLGKAHLAYFPGASLTGLSKLARLVDILSRRLQIQERMTRQLREAMDAALQPVGSAVVVEAEHLCMTARGVRKRGSRVVTTSWSGRFDAEHAERRALLEILALPASVEGDS